MAFSPTTFRSYSQRHPKSHPNPIYYGTSGPRDDGEDIDSFIFRMGIIAAVRSRTMEGYAVGMMITAGHNQHEENGVIMIDTNGEILDEPWEPLCDKLGNEADNKLEAATQHLIRRLHIDNPGLVYIGRDTRFTSASLVVAATDGVRSLDSSVRDFGVLTTAQLHHIVYITNKGLPDPSEAGYFTRYVSAFKDLYATINAAQNRYVPKLYIDCANGVGGIKLQKAKKQLKTHLDLVLHNIGPGFVHRQCGAVFIDTEKKPPIGCNISRGERWASISGDFGRVYFAYQNDLGELRVLNGDKIMALISTYIKELVVISKLSDEVSYQIVASAYTNRKTVYFMKKYSGTNVECTAPGMKNLMKKRNNSGISICYETSGHGTVCYKKEAYTIIKNKAETDPSAKRLLKILELMPQTHSDAFCTLLLIESILRHKDWKMRHWDALYETNPSRLLQVSVTNRHFIKTNDICTVVVKPEALKDDINGLVAGFPEDSRVLVRPSGTEDFVLVYAESDTQENADELAKQTVKLVEAHAKIASQLAKNK